MPIALLAVPELIEGAEVAYTGYRIYRAARAAQALVRAAEAARRLQQAAEAANTVLQSQAAVKGCATCRKEEIPCFDTPLKGTDAEMERQLREQQDAINKLSPEKLLDNLAKNRDSAGRIVRPADDAATRSAARTAAEATLKQRLEKQYLDAGRAPGEAKRLAATEAAQEMEGKQMLHTPDLRAGGDGTLSPVPGGSSENQSIGSQWNTKGDGETRTRGEVLEQEAANAKARGDGKMDVKLKKCEPTS